ncbi:hypothetical protein NDU88_002158 [Pleurodeles waltl]|uniref:Uncharacterized protein n=1 Tax=Pleurodeles waltl TaxID=8319 RepID=A0AAV7RB59_PLEWA|nr:hypothetical protein NDU88_002158 [Pleurodeles waltl]
MSTQRSHTETCMAPSLTPGLTCGAPELPGAGTNQLCRRTVTVGPGRGTAEPRGEEKPASWTQEACNREAEESGAVGERTRPRTKQEDEEETGGGTNLAAAREE